MLTLRTEHTLIADPIVLPSGSSVHVAGDLLKNVESISNLLGISQLLSVSLALQAEAQRPRYPSRSIPEVATYLFHDWTAKLLEFMREILQVTISPSAEQGAPFDGLRQWVNELLFTKNSLGKGKGEGTLVDQILTQIDDVNMRVDILIRSPRTVGPGFDLLSFRIGALRTEQNKMVGILGIIGQGGLLGRGHVIKILKWLKKCHRVDALVGGVLT